MLDRTNNIIDFFRTIEWFESAGKIPTRKVDLAKTWHEALLLSDSVAWENLRLEAGNAISYDVSIKHPNKLQDWNPLVGKIRSEIRPMVDYKIATLVAKENLPQSFRHHVEWDMLHIAIATEFADYSIPTLYAELAYWYAMGHYPCGWTGDYPDGTLVVF